MFKSRFLGEAIWMLNKSRKLKTLNDITNVAVSPAIALIRYWRDSKATVHTWFVEGGAEQMLEIS